MLDEVNRRLTKYIFIFQQLKTFVVPNKICWTVEYTKLQRVRLGQLLNNSPIDAYAGIIIGEARWPLNMR